MAVAYWMSTHSAQLGDQMPTRSPRSIPCASRPRRDAVDRGVELGVGEAQALVAADERLAVGEPRDRALEVVADRLAQQRDVVGAVAVGRTGHVPPSVREPYCLDSPAAVFLRSGAMRELPDDEGGGSQPPYLHADYVSTRLRAPARPLLVLPDTLEDPAVPAYGHAPVGELEHDLTRQHEGEPLGERIVVTGRVLERDGRPVPSTLVEVWQANAAGRYRHADDQHPAPLDPNFSGAGRCLADEEGRYRFVTVKPGAYPWRNHENAWRPAHVHFSVFGRAFTDRLVTQMYFPGDPLFAHDPILQSVRDPAARERLVAAFDWTSPSPSGRWAIASTSSLGGGRATPLVS